MDNNYNCDNNCLKTIKDCYQAINWAVDFGEEELNEISCIAIGYDGYSNHENYFRLKWGGQDPFDILFDNKLIIASHIRRRKSFNMWNCYTRWFGDSASRKNCVLKHFNTFLRVFFTQAQPIPMHDTPDTKGKEKENEKQPKPETNDIECDNKSSEEMVLLDTGLDANGNPDDNIDHDDNKDKDHKSSMDLCPLAMSKIYFIHLTDKSKTKQLIFGELENNYDKTNDVGKYGSDDSDDSIRVLLLSDDGNDSDIGDVDDGTSYEIDGLLQGLRYGMEHFKYHVEYGN